MNAPSICRNCLRRIARQQPKINTFQGRPLHIRTYFSKSTTPAPSSTPDQNSPKIDPSALLSTPTWSIRSLLSSSSSSPPQNNPQITPTQLTHLLRLSALPTPSSPRETHQILSTLQSQLLFVREIQKVDTTGIRPLPAIRDESTPGLEETTLSLDTPSIRDALSPEKEESFGHCKRPRRIRTPIFAGGGEGEGSEENKDWDVLGTASEKAGRYFVVRSKKARGD